MMRRIAPLALVLGFGAGAAVAVPPASKDACLDQAFALAEKAAAKKLSTDSQAKVEGLLSALEEKCAADNLAGAEADIKAVEAAIAGG